MRSNMESCPYWPGLGNLTLLEVPIAAKSTNRTESFCQNDCSSGTWVTSSICSVLKVWICNNEDWKCHQEVPRPTGAT